MPSSMAKPVATGIKPVAVTANDEAIDMGPTEYRLLAFFMSHQERAYSRTQMLDQVWGGNVYVEDRTIDVHIRRLRKALEPFGYDRFIQTVRGTGYRFSVKADTNKQEVIFYKEISSKQLSWSGLHILL